MTPQEINLTIARLVWPDKTWRGQSNLAYSLEISGFLFKETIFDYQNWNDLMPLILKESAIKSENLLDALYSENPQQQLALLYIQALEAKTKVNNNG